MVNKKILLLLLIPLTLSFSFDETVQTLTGDWSLICFSDLITGQQDCKPNDDPSQIVELKFMDDGKKGTMTGYSHPNRVSGSYTISGDKKIKVDSFGGTKIAEHGWVSNFKETIYLSSSFTYNATGDTLSILYDNDTKAMKFVKH